MLCAAVYLGLKSTDGLRLMAHSEPVPAPAEDSRSLELLELAKAETHQQNTDQMEQASLIVASTLQSVDYFDPIDAFAVSAVAEAEGARKDEVEVAPPKEALAAQPMPSADDFKLSAIIRGPDGATAIINGKFVKVGGDVKGATLIKLGRHTAELEIRGRRLVIQM